MKRYSKPFMAAEPEFIEKESAAIAILPFPYEGGISYGQGTSKAPDAILLASAQVEYYDERLEFEPIRMGICTVEPPYISPNPAEMIDTLYKATKSLLAENKFVVVIGGDHSITSGYFKALMEKYGRLSVIQIDAHADLRDVYQDSPWSHASVMARIREQTDHTLQLGIRSLCREEAEKIKTEKIACYKMTDIRKTGFDLQAVLASLPDPVFLTLDVDALNTDIIMNTGTPEPGGFTWDEILDTLETIFLSKTIVGFDVVELAYQANDLVSPFATAKLIYKMLGFKCLAAVKNGMLKTIPKYPNGPVLMP